MFAAVRFFFGVVEALLAIVERMVVGHVDGLDAAGFENARIRGGRLEVESLLLDVVALGERSLEVADGEVVSAQHGCHVLEEVALRCVVVLGDEVGRGVEVGIRSERAIAYCRDRERGVEPRLIRAVGIAARQVLRRSLVVLLLLRGFLLLVLGLFARAQERQTAAGKLPDARDDDEHDGKREHDLGPGLALLAVDHGAAVAAPAARRIPRVIQAMRVSAVKLVAGVPAVCPACAAIALLELPRV